MNYYMLKPQKAHSNSN